MSSYLSYQHFSLLLLLMFYLILLIFVLLFFFFFLFFFLCVLLLVLVSLLLVIVFVLVLVLLLLVLLICLVFFFLFLPLTILNILFDVLSFSLVSFDVCLLALLVGSTVPLAAHPDVGLARWAVLLVGSLSVYAGLLG